MNRKKNVWKGCAPYLCAFFIPVLVMICVFIERGIFPFGEMSFLRTDLYHQYAPFFQEMKTKLSAGESLLYSWNIGMGTNFAALFAYYLASPVNWLLALCPQKYVIEFITYFIVIKIGLSSLFMTVYLTKHNGKKDFSAAFFGIFYGLSGYMAAYSWNIMWLDCILLFPLIILGLERLVEKDKCFLYCITLALAILSNYYISIMICIFLILYFLVLLILSPTCTGVRYLKKMMQFAVFSLLAGGLAAVTLLPEIYALNMTASSSINFPQTVTSYFSIFDMMARHLVDVETHIGLDHWPNIYCGVAILFLLPLYILNRRVSAYEKFAYCFMALFFYLSFSNNILNFIWHGLHFPNSLPARQSFIYIFLILTMSYKGYEGIRYRSIKQLVGCMWLAIGFVVLAEKIVTESFFQWDCYYLSILFIALYGGLAYLYRKEQLVHSMAAVLVLILVFAESFVNTTVTSVTTTNRTSYVKDDAAIREIMNSIEEKESGFYRVEKTKIRTKNDGAWLGYPSISLFSSTANANLTNFFKKLGMESSTNAYGSVGSTFLSNMLLGVKYNISSTELEDSSSRTLYRNKDGIYVYENTYALPLGFMADSDLDSQWQAQSTNPFDNLNSFALVTADISDLYTVQSITETGSSSTVTVNTDGYTYLYVNKTGPNKVQVVDSEGISTTYDNLNRGYILDMGYRNAGEILTITPVVDDNSTQASTLSVTAYRMDEAKLKRVYQRLSQSPMTVDSYDSTHVTGRVTARKDGLLLTTIPYEKGWSVTVDGQTVEPQIFSDTFISIPLTTGSHTISFSYMPDGLVPGALLTGGSILVTVALYLITRFLSKKKRKKEDLLAEGELIKNLSSGEYFIPENDEEEIVNTQHVEEIMEQKKRETGELPDSIDVDNAAEQTTTAGSGTIFAHPKAEHVPQASSQETITTPSKELLRDSMEETTQIPGDVTKKL